MESRASWRLRLALLAFAVVALIAMIQGLLHGPWYQALGGFAVMVTLGYLAFRVPRSLMPDQLYVEAAATKRPDGSRSWPLIAASLLWTAMALGFVILVLVAPFQDVVDFNKGVGRLVKDLASLVGEWGARILVAALFAAVGFASAKTAWQRYRD